MKKPVVSIIVRTKNEERWIGRCLRMVHQQDFKDFEVVVVDNRSTDHTVAVARKFPVKVVTIDAYRPGDALNVGIRASRGRYIACLSAHCIPNDEHWLGNLVRNMSRKDVAGVYGRQLPMSYSSALDKRDLLNTFGLDHRIQVKDSFFHNANSLVRRSVWEELPFDAAATNIEDRIWGKAVIARGLKLAYEPEAAVFHYHGIHQDGDQERARNVVRILESLHDDSHADAAAHALNVLTVLPVVGPVVSAAGKDLLERCLSQLAGCGTLRDKLVLAEDPGALATARRSGAAALARPPELAAPETGLETALQYALRSAESGTAHYDAVLYVNYLFPFRPDGFFESLTRRFAESGVDSLVPTIDDYVASWSGSGGNIVRADEGFLPHKLKTPMRRGLVGLGTLSSGEFVRRGSLLGATVGLLPLDNKLYSMKASDPFDLVVIRLALERGSAQFGA